MASESDVTEGSVTLNDVFCYLAEARSDRLRMEADLKKSLDFCHEKIKESCKKIQEQTKEINQYFKNLEELMKENNVLKTKVLMLENKLEQIEQYSRLNTVEIYGIPQKPDEDVTEVVKKVGLAVNMNITEETIDFCHRLRPKEGRPAGIIVRFVRRKDRAKLLQRKRMKAKLHTGDMGYSTSSPIYINENLTFHRNKILAAARKIKAQNDFRFLWVRDGKILMRKEEKSPLIRINTMEDLKNLSPMRKQGGFKIPTISDSVLAMDVYSQAVNEDENDSYENDSFCCDETEIEQEEDPSLLEIAENMLKKKNKRRKRTKKRRVVQFDSDDSHIDNTRAISLSSSDSSSDKEKFSNKRKRLLPSSESSSEEQSRGRNRPKIKKKNNHLLTSESDSDVTDIGD